MEQIKLVEDAPVREVVDEIKKHLDEGGRALVSTYLLKKDDNGLWTASIVDALEQPSKQTCTCVGTSWNVAQWLEKLMSKPQNQYICLKIMDEAGYHDMMYAFHESK